MVVYLVGHQDYEDYNLILVTSNRELAEKAASENKSSRGRKATITEVRMDEVVNIDL